MIACSLVTLTWGVTVGRAQDWWQCGGEKRKKDEDLAASLGKECTSCGGMSELTLMIRMGQEDLFISMFLLKWDIWMKPHRQPLLLLLLLII